MSTMTFRSIIARRHFFPWYAPRASHYLFNDCKSSLLNSSWSICREMINGISSSHNSRRSNWREKYRNLCHNYLIGCCWRYIFVYYIFYLYFGSHECRSHFCTGLELSHMPRTTSFGLQFCGRRVLSTGRTIPGYQLLSPIDKNDNNTRRRKQTAVKNQHLNNCFVTYNQ